MSQQYVEVAIAAKWFLKSKTLWLNFITIAVLVLGLIIDNAAALGVPDNVKIMIGIAIAAINAIGNAILRIMPENQPIAATRGKYQIAYLPKVGSPPEHPATNPPRWGQDWRDVGPT